VEETRFLEETGFLSCPVEETRFLEETGFLED